VAAGVPPFWSPAGATFFSLGSMRREVIEPFPLPWPDGPWQQFAQARSQVWQAALPAAWVVGALRRCTWAGLGWDGLVQAARNRPAPSPASGAPCFISVDGLRWYATCEAGLFAAARALYSEEDRPGVLQGVSLEVWQLDEALRSGLAILEAVVERRGLPWVCQVVRKTVDVEDGPGWSIWRFQPKVRILRRCANRTREDEVDAEGLAAILAELNLAMVKPGASPRPVSAARNRRLPKWWQRK